MFFLFILGIIALIVAVIAAIVGFTTKSSDGKAVFGVALVLALLLCFVSGCRQVGTKEIGVPTSFGAVGTKHYGAGLHFVKPWTKIHQMDGAIQTLNEIGNNCLSVRIANNQTGCVNVSLQWRINPAQVDYLYKNYRSFDHVRDQLVERKLFNAVNEQLASYNPLALISQKGKANPLPAFQSRIYNAMKQKVKDINGQPLIDIVNVQLPLVVFDAETQSRVNQLQQQVAQTAIATQEQKTNAARAIANQDLAKKSLTTNVLVSRCLDTLETLVKQKQNVPAGFSCWPGGSLAGVIATNK